MRHSGRMMTRAVESSLACLIIVLGALGPAPTLLAQETQVVPPAESASPHSTVDVLTLPPAGRAPTQGMKRLEQKPVHVPDPEGLQQWKERLKQSPEVLPPAPGFVEDKKR
jgi:hypothetical protein